METMDLSESSEGDEREIALRGTVSTDVTKSLHLEDIDSLLCQPSQHLEDLQANYIFYDLNCDEVLMVLIRPCTLHFFGSVKIKCLAGRAETLGYVLDPSRAAVDLYSCKGFSALYVSTVDEEEFSPDISLVSNLGVSLMEATKICNRLKSGGCILLLSEPVRRQHMRQRTGRAENRFGLILDTPRKRIGNITSIQPEIRIDIPVGITVLCGGKSVGKSTSLRYLTNRALNSHPQLLYIDLDIGQPEFTLHECVSATLVDTPVIGPSYTHFRKPVRSYNVGNINGSRCVVAYIRAVELLVEECRKLYSDIPWLVNTMGFCRDVGVYLTCTCISILNPSILIQITGDKSQNFPSDLTPEFVQSVSKRAVGSYNLIIIEKGLNAGNGRDKTTGVSFSNKQVRWLATENYFSDPVRPSYPLVVPVEYLKVFNVIDKTLIPEDQYSNLITKLVILSPSNSLDTPPQALDYGVIVSFVQSERVFLILTPLEPGVNVMNIESILVGSLQIPSGINKPVSASARGIVPYCQIRKSSEVAPTVRPIKKTYKFLFETSNAFNHTEPTFSSAM